MQRFVAEQNIEHFKASLASETDEGRRAMLKRLLAEEVVKLAAENAKLPDDATDDPEDGR